MALAIMMLQPLLLLVRPVHLQVHGSHSLCPLVQVHPSLLHPLHCHLLLLPPPLALHPWLQSPLHQGHALLLPPCPSLPSLPWLLLLLHLSLLASWQLEASHPLLSRQARRHGRQHLYSSAGKKGYGRCHEPYDTN
jgi:hypothetical protein